MLIPHADPESIVTCYRRTIGALDALWRRRDVERAPAWQDLTPHQFEAAMRAQREELDLQVSTGQLRSSDSD